MSKTTPTITIAAVALVASLMGCDDPTPAVSAPSASTSPTSLPAATGAPSTTPPKEKVKEPSHPCPDGSKGEGTSKKPCVATGASRMMEVRWNGKIKENGPLFRVKSKAKLEILYGSVFVYFYDAAGKQLEVEHGGKKSPYRTCGGRIFAGPMKAGEIATLTFSCVKKKHVPEGATAIEAEMRTVGFTGKDGKPDTYWRNKDLVPGERPKGGIK